MRWGLSQGLIGAHREALAPSGRALGRNIYLSPRDFWKMIGVAFVVHVLAVVVASLWPSNTVTDIPVRALSFRLGDADRTAAYAPAPSVADTSPPIAPPVMQAVSADSWRATPLPSPVVPAPLKPLPKPMKAPKVVKEVAKIKESVPLPAQPAPPPPAIAPLPQQYVREAGGVPEGVSGGQGVSSNAAAQTEQAIRTRYEQQISGWIQRHKLYPAEAGGREGRAVVRVRIDRAGNVRYYAIEQSAGMTALDNAALDMIRRANPVPAVPENYPAGTLVEFLIPITFKAPQ